MTCLRLCLTAMALAVIISAPAAAQSEAESGWSIKKLIPRLPEKSAKPKTKAEPSTFTKINNSTKAFFAKSKALVPSWLMPETQDRVRQYSQSLQNSATNIRQEVRTAKRKTLLPWISRPEPEPKKPETVPDFLALPKPGY